MEKEELEKYKRVMRKLYFASVDSLIRRYLQNLWHDASEKPDPGTPCLVYGVFTCEDKEPYEDYTVSYHTLYGWTEDFFPQDYDYTITRWCYVDDLLPKKGGEQC